jgi:hypothetical protein
VAGVRLRYSLNDTIILLLPMLVVLAAILVWPQIPRRLSMRAAFSGHRPPLQFSHCHVGFD